MENAENINLFVDPSISKIRCKMNVNALKDVGGSIRVEMGAVYSSRPDGENKSFATATPCAFFLMDISKDTPASRAPWLQPGAQVYVDLQLAEIPEWNWSGDRHPEENRKIEIRRDSLDNESLTGIFRKEVDEGFKRLANNTYKYPLLELEDGTKYYLYLNTNNTYVFYWKYVD